MSVPRGSSGRVPYLHRTRQRGAASGKPGAAAAAVSLEHHVAVRAVKKYLLQLRAAPCRAPNPGGCSGGGGGGSKLQRKQRQTEEAEKPGEEEDFAQRSFRQHQRFAGGGQLKAGVVMRHKNRVEARVQGLRSTDMSSACIEVVPRGDTREAGGFAKRACVSFVPLWSISASNRRRSKTRVQGRGLATWPTHTSCKHTPQGKEEWRCVRAVPPSHAQRGLAAQRRYVQAYRTQQELWCSEAELAS